MHGRCRGGGDAGEAAAPIDEVSAGLVTDHRGGCAGDLIDQERGIALFATLPKNIPPAATDI